MILISRGQEHRTETDKLEELCDAFNLKSLVKSETCLPSTINL